MISAVSPLMKNVVTSLAKIVLITLRLTVAASAACRCSYSRENFWIGGDCTDNFEQGNGRYRQSS